MNKSAAGFCKRLYDSICAQYGPEKADEICGRGVGSAATAQQKGRWAAETMDRVADAFAPEQQADVMAGCACGPGQGQLESARRFWKASGSLREYCDRRNDEMKGGARFETRDGLLYISYPRCYCSMIKNSSQPIPKTWCLCSCEYTRRACSYAFDRPVAVKLLKSAASGDGECLFEVTLL